MANNHDLHQFTQKYTIHTLIITSRFLTNTTGKHIKKSDGMEEIVQHWKLSDQPQQIQTENWEHPSHPPSPSTDRQAQASGDHKILSGTVGSDSHASQLP